MPTTREDVRRSIFKVKEPYQGTAFRVGERWALSVVHVASKDGLEKIPQDVELSYNANGKGIRIKGKYRPDKSCVEGDLAAIELIDLPDDLDEKIPQLELSLDHQPYEAVTAFGISQGQTRRIHQVPGTIDPLDHISEIAFEGINNPMKVLIVDTRRRGQWADKAVREGMSGGPIWNKRTGTVVALVEGAQPRGRSRYLEGPEGYGILLDYLEKHVKDMELRFTRMASDPSMNSARYICKKLLGSRLFLFKHNFFFPLFMDPISKYQLIFATVCFAATVYVILAGKRLCSLPDSPFLIQNWPVVAPLFFLLFSSITMKAWAINYRDLFRLIRDSKGVRFRNILADLNTHHMAMLPLDVTQPPFLGYFSGGGIFFCHLLEIFKRWKKDNLGHLIPPWGKKLLDNATAFFFIPGLSTNGEFTRQEFEEPDHKLEAVEEWNRRAKDHIKYIVSDSDLKETLSQKWANITNAEVPEWKEGRWQSYQYAKSGQGDSRITLVACTDVRSFIGYLRRMERGLAWPIGKGLMILVLLFLFFLPSRPLPPAIEVKFIPAKQFVIGPDGTPKIRMNPKEQVVVELLVSDPETDKDFYAMIQSDNLDLLKNETKGNLRREIYRIVHSKERYQFLLMGSSITIPLNIAVTDSYKQVTQKSYVFESEL